MFFILFFLVVSVNAYVFNEQFLKVNCDYYLSEESECNVYKWRFPDEPKCVPWDLSQCESYVKYETSCIEFSCSTFLKTEEGKRFLTGALQWDQKPNTENTTPLTTTAKTEICPPCTACPPCPSFTTCPPCPSFTTCPPLIPAQCPPLIICPEITPCPIEAVQTDPIICPPHPDPICPTHPEPTLAPMMPTKIPQHEDECKAYTCTTTATYQDGCMTYLHSLTNDTNCRLFCELEGCDQFYDPGYQLCFEHKCVLKPVPIGPAFHFGHPYLYGLVGSAVVIAALIVGLMCLWRKYRGMLPYRMTTNFDSPQNESTPIIRANTNRLLGSTSNSGLFSLENANFHDVDLHAGDDGDESPESDQEQPSFSRGSKDPLNSEAEGVHLSGRSSSLPSSSVPSSSVPSSSVPSSSVPSSSLTEIVQPSSSGLRTIFPKKDSFKFWKNKKRVERPEENITADGFQMSNFSLNGHHVRDSQIQAAVQQNLPPELRTNIRL